MRMCGCPCSVLASARGCSWHIGIPEPMAGTHGSGLGGLQAATDNTAKFIQTSSRPKAAQKETSQSSSAQKSLTLCRSLVVKGPNSGIRDRGLNPGFPTCVTAAPTSRHSHHTVVPCKSHCYWHEMGMERSILDEVTFLSFFPVRHPIRKAKC